MLRPACLVVLAYRSRAPVRGTGDATYLGTFETPSAEIRPMKETNTPGRLRLADVTLKHLEKRVVSGYF